MPDDGGAVCEDCIVSVWVLCPSGCFVIFVFCMNLKASNSTMDVLGVRWFSSDTQCLLSFVVMNEFVRLFYVSYKWQSDYIYMLLLVQLWLLVGLLFHNKFIGIL